MTHICVSKLTIIGSDNGLMPGRGQAIIWANAGILLIWTLGNKLKWNLNQNSYIFIQENAFENVVWRMAAILSRPQCVKIWSVPYICHHCVVLWCVGQYHSGPQLYLCKACNISKVLGWEIMALMVYNQCLFPHLIPGLLMMIHGLAL